MFIIHVSCAKKINRSMKIKTFYVEQKMAEIVGNDVCVKILKNTYTV